MSIHLCLSLLFQPYFSFLPSSFLCLWYVISLTEPSGVLSVSVGLPSPLLGGFVLLLLFVILFLLTAS